MLFIKQIKLFALLLMLGHYNCFAQIIQNLEYASKNKIDYSSTNVINKTNGVFLDTIGIIPMTSDNGKKYLFRVHNNTSYNYNIESIELNAGVLNNGSVTAKAFCNNIIANSSCSIQISILSKPARDVVIKIILRDNLGKKNELHQFLRVAGSKNVNSSISDAIDVVSVEEMYGLSLPIVLGQDFDTVNAQNGSLLCSGSKLVKGASCNYLMSGHVNEDNTLVKAALVGIKNGKRFEIYNADILVKTGLHANLLLSSGVEIIEGVNNTTSVIKVYNNGNAIAELTNFLPSSPLKIKGNTCTDTLAPSGSCEITVGLEGDTSAILSGTSGFTLHYKDGVSAKHVSVNVDIITKNKLAQLSLSPEGDLINTIVGNTKIQLITIKNTSSTTISGLQISNSFPVGFTLSDADNYSCSKGVFELKPNEVCKINVIYTPIREAQNAVTQLRLLGTFMSAGTSRRYQLNYKINIQLLLSLRTAKLLRSSTK